MSDFNLEDEWNNEIFPERVEPLLEFLRSRGIAYFTGFQISESGLDVGIAISAASRKGGGMPDLLRLIVAITEHPGFARVLGEHWADIWDHAEKNGMNPSEGMQPDAEGREAMYPTSRSGMSGIVQQIAKALGIDPEVLLSDARKAINRTEEMIEAGEISDNSEETVEEQLGDIDEWLESL